jgi:CubicO group peptidase (beta-lactamase class C family)
MAGEDPRAELDALLGEARLAGAFSGAVALVEVAGERRYEAAIGQRATHPWVPGREAPVGLDAVFDLASLTKVLVTTTLAAQAISSGRLALDAVIPADWRGPWLRAGQRPATLEELLLHRSGLPAHREFFTHLRGDRERFAAAVTREELEAPPGARTIYSDLGFMLLGAWLERSGDGPLDELFARDVAGPSGLGPTALGFAPGPREDVVVTEVYDPSLHATAPSWFAVREERFAWGRVHDDNAAMMGGIAPHAGLFGGASAVCTLGAAWMDARVPGVDPRVHERFTRPRAVPGSTRCLGFDAVAAEGGATGGALSPASYGHLGFTGTSLWIDPVRRAVYVLLTNRVHPTRQNDQIQAIRPRFHRLGACV